ncbi:MAG: exodeoxyribonuclease VII large subunit [Dehalococcoidia bacterium]|nr:exodeoxyribonuclease VII large subunit [Dehalococcoidia bacterium]
MPVYGVSQITKYIKEALEMDTLLQDLWVQGEVSNALHAASGHWYFTLKDDKGQLRSVMFKPVWRRTNGDNGGQFIQNGAKVTTHGRISIYETRGDLQMVVDLVQPDGVGELALKLELLKKRLQEEGLFEPSRKRPLPKFPQRIGVVTSPNSAVWRDIQNVVARRYPLVELVLAPCQVQGDIAAQTISEAFRTLANAPDIDVIILARGGGSLEELWPFNEEIVARAIFSCPVPVISGVGHETDFTIADLVADMRAPTPSAAAELAVPDVRELRHAVFQQYRATEDAMVGMVYLRRAELTAAVDRLRRRAPDVTQNRQRIDDLLHAMATRLANTVAMDRERLGGYSARLTALDPSQVLRRGYAMVQRADTGKVVSSSKQVATGDKVAVRLTDGSFEADVR